MINKNHARRLLSMVIRLLFLSVIFTLGPLSFAATINTPEQDSPAIEVDYIYLKDTDKNQLGFVKVPGEIKNLTRDYVLFKKEGAEPVRLYTKEDVRRVELGKAEQRLKKFTDDKRRTEFKKSREKLTDIAEQHWNRQTLHANSTDAMLVEMAKERLPSGVLVSLLLLAGLYLIVTTFLQAYNRFVIESSIKRLNAEKLLGEIKKTRAEIFNLRNSLGVPASEVELNSLISAVDPEEKIKTGGKVTAGTSAGAADVRVEEFQGAEVLLLRIIKQIFGVPTQEIFASRKKALVDKWRKQSTGWLNFRRSLGLTIYYIVMIGGWILSLGWVGAAILFIAAPEPQGDLSGGGIFVFIFTVIALGVLVGLERLRQNHKIRKAAYDEVVYPGTVPQADLQESAA